MEICMPFIPNTDSDRRLMLERIGVKNFEELISNIPNELKFKGNLNIPDPVSELEVSRIIQNKAKKKQMMGK